MDREIAPAALAIDKLCGDIGQERAVRVLEFALPRIVGFERDIREFISAGNHAAAADCAHRAISSVRAYGTVRLETLLREASAEDCDFKRLQPELSKEFALVIDFVDSWLRTNSKL